jgi:hypothetical protein
MNPLPRLRKRLAQEEAVWRALRSEPAPHVDAVREALSTGAPDITALRDAGLAAVSSAFLRWNVPAPHSLQDAAACFAMLPDAGDALVGAAIAELSQTQDLAAAAEGLELVLDWTWGVLRGDARDLSAVLPAAPEPGPPPNGRTRRLVVAGLGVGLLVSALLLADPFHWFGGGNKKKRQKGHRKKKGKAAKGAKAGGAGEATVQDSPTATRDGQKKKRK